MAGTNAKARTPDSKALDSPPAVVLVKPQLSENIGMVARAMLNCGLKELRLVAPFQEHLNKKAVRAAAGAENVLENTKIFESVPAALADFNTVFAATVRIREAMKHVYDPRETVKALRQASIAGERTAFMFGREKSGLDNEDISHADALVTIPLNPGFSSLNLAQSVLIMGYEWYQAGLEMSPAAPLDNVEKASKQELTTFFDQLETQLDASGYYNKPDMRQRLIQNMRNMFQRAELTKSEVVGLHGIVKALSGLKLGQKKSKESVDI